MTLHTRATRDAMASALALGASERHARAALALRGVA
jgi:hypothetical protein